MPTEAEVGQARADARKVAERLRGMLARHEAGRVRVQPGELPVNMHRNVPANWRSAALFACMACDTVAAKYRHANRADVAAAIGRQQRIASEAIVGPPEAVSLAVRPERPCKGLITLYRRLGNHRSRIAYGGDPDLHLCDVHTFHLYGDCLVPWAFQQDDLRYRWTDGARGKLRYLADCWDAYSRCGFAPADTAIGASAFPLSPRLLDDSGVAGLRVAREGVDLRGMNLRKLIEEGRR